MEPDLRDQVETINYLYTFTFPNGKSYSLQANLNSQTLTIIPDQTGAYPEWTKLSYHQCDNCPLDELHYPQCPAAVSMISLINFCKNLESCQEVTVTVASQQRNYSKKTTLQIGLSSIAGIYMACSGCPIMAKLKPMARFHLPFADVDETSYRVFSMYFLAQYFLAQEGKKPDWNMNKLDDTYRKIASVNKTFCDRIRSVVLGDAGVNAVIVLDTLGNFIRVALDLDKIQDLKHLFTSYLHE